MRKFLYIVEGEYEFHTGIDLHGVDNTHFCVLGTILATSRQAAIDTAWDECENRGDCGMYANSIPHSVNAMPYSRARRCVQDYADNCDHLAKQIKQEQARINRSPLECP